MKESARSSRGFTVGRIAVYAVLCAYLVAVVYPMIWLVTTSLKPSREIFLHPFAPPKLSELQFVNFTNAWQKAHFGRYFLNSVIVTSSTVAITVLLAAMTSYALARFRFIAARPLLLFFMAGMILPIQLCIVPLFFELKAFDLLNSRTGVSLAYIALGFPFAIFVLTGFFKTLPTSIHESALLDGATEWQAFWHVMLPLARPGLITVTIFLFLGNWNEFFVAFICLSGKDSEAARTLPLGLANITIVSQYRSDWGVAIAGLVLIMLPTLAAYILLQKHLTKGITTGAIKA